MSRMDVYDDYDCESNVYFLWPSVTDRALNGKRGQEALKELESALLALPQPRLLEGKFCDGTEVCALGALALKRQVQSGVALPEALSEIHRRFEYWDEECDPARFAAEALKLTYSVAFQVMSKNESLGTTPEERYQKVLEWVRSWIKSPKNAKEK